MGVLLHLCFRTSEQLVAFATLCFRSRFATYSTGQPFCRVDTLMADSKLLCRLCGLEHPKEGGRLHGPSFTCSGCWAAKAMLERNLGSKSDLKDFNQSETHAFFRAIAKEKAKKGGRVTWVTVRASLIRSLTDRRISSFRSTCTKRELPLSVWVSQGWEESTVLAQPNWYSEELKTQVYAVPVRELQWKEEYEKIEQQILQHEREGQKKKGSKSKKKNDDNEVGSSDGELDLPSADGSTLTALSKIFERVEKSASEIPEGFLQAHAGCKGKLEKWASAARECVNIHESTRALWKDAGGDLLPLPPLPFDAAEVKTLQKTTAEVQSALRALLPQKQPRAKAETKAKAKAKGSPSKPDRRQADAEAGSAGKRRRVKSPA
eukprot:s391_g12.t1